MLGQMEFCDCTHTLQVMADIVSSLLEEKNTPAFEVTDEVFIIIINNLCHHGNYSEVYND